MSAFQQHIEKYQHNQSFCSFGISKKKGDFSDWEITARFYAAIHLIEAIMDKELNRHSKNHDERDRIMGDNPEIFPRECSKDYSTLKALARKARYETTLMSNQDAFKAQSCLEDLVSQYKKYIKEDA